MTSAQIARQAFLDFFEEMGHKPVASSSLVPANDPTLLFTNAGMVQFKDVFLGLDKRDYSRATTSQKCMRVSGKHNDLENVGPSPRHHTFFEMLGNFSFGDYFKRDAIKYAYMILTEVYKLPTERLVYTVYEHDDEAYDYWVKDVGVDPKRVARMGPSTNFWQMADTGPCGPTSEIHWDKTPRRWVKTASSRCYKKKMTASLKSGILVFMQFNRQQADPDHTGEWDEPLPAPGVDTGMGLERIVAVLQGANANYETDLYSCPLSNEHKNSPDNLTKNEMPTLCPIASLLTIFVPLSSLLVMVFYRVLKVGLLFHALVIRRAARFGTKLGFDEPFLAQVADAVIDVMGEHYTELVEQADNIKRVITLEEERFHRTMERGLTELEAMLDELEEWWRTYLVKMHFI